MDAFRKRMRKTMRAGKKTLRSGMNKVMDAVGEFEEKGGVRGAYERGRARAERLAEQVKDTLEDKGVGKYVPISSTAEQEVRQHYKTLGVDFDAGIDEVKSAYRDKMRKYHPDRHAGNAEAEKDATLIAQQVTVAYEAVEAYLKRRGRL